MTSLRKNLKYVVASTLVVAVVGSGVVMNSRASDKADGNSVSVESVENVEQLNTGVDESSVQALETKSEENEKTPIVEEAVIAPVEIVGPTEAECKVFDDTKVADLARLAVVAAEESDLDNISRIMGLQNQQAYLDGYEFNDYTESTTKRRWAIQEQFRAAHAADKLEVEERILEGC